MSRFCLRPYILLFVSLILVVFVSGCSDAEPDVSVTADDVDSAGLDSGVPDISGAEDVANNSVIEDEADIVDTADGAVEAVELNRFQIMACNAADEAGTCDTKLVELGIVSKYDCCEALSKCC